MGEAREIFDRATAGINAHDAQAIAACYAENAEVRDPFGPHRGRQEIAAYWEVFFTAFPDARGEAVRKYEVGDTAIDEWEFEGTHTGPLVSPDGSAIPATGKTVRMRGADFGRVENGLIAEHRIYFDQMEMLAQLGLVPEPAAATTA